MIEKFDIEIKKELKDALNIDYGIIKGNSTILFIKAGQNGSLYGYKNKYLKMARRANKKYGCSVICSSNPFDGTNPLDNAFEVIDYYAKNFNDYKVYYLGFSNGALIGAWFGTKYEKIKRLCLVNGPLMYNLHKTKECVQKYDGEGITFVYGELDQSYKYLKLLEKIADDKIKIYTLHEDHYFSLNEEDFQTLPDKYLFYDE